MTVAPPKVSEMELPASVAAILSGKCTACHSFGQRDPAGWGSALDVSRMVASDIVVPGDPDHSRLWNRVAVRADMPFNGQRLSGPELLTLRAWIQNLPRPFQRPRSNEQILDLLVQDRARAGNRDDIRYISFAHYVDAKYSPEEMKAARAVLNVVINSLSRGRSIFTPEPIDADQSIFRFRLQDVGWSRQDWDRLTSFNPYCLRSDRREHQDLYNRLNTESPFVRGDWFVSTAMQPPLYHDLLDLDKSIDEVARNDLGVDINNDIQRGTIDRLGFRSSGVSLHNRVFERHRTNDNGYLWVSYDFDTDLNDGDIRRNPLGPRNRDDRFEHSFQNLAGEMIWSLPNGMQAYLLALADGTRIDKAVPTVVRDQRQLDGNVTNGISCIGCHGVGGMNFPRIFDEIPTFVREHAGDFTRGEQDQVRRVYPAQGQALLQADAQRYLNKLRPLIGDHLPNPGVIEYDDYINLYSEYQSKVGLRAGTIELQTDQTTVLREVRTRADNEGELPLTLSDPLVTRDDWTCRFRRIIRDVRRANFCRNTFDAPELDGFCDNR